MSEGNGEVRKGESVVSLLRPSLQHSAFSLQHCLLLLLALCPYFIDLGGSSIWDANEAFYVETPREMMERGDYINPMFNYEPRVNKPVLSYWIVAGFYHLFGVSVGVQRVPIALGGVALIFTALMLARAAAPPGSAAVAGWWAAIGLAISPRLVMFARRIFIDIYISMFLALTLMFFVLAERFPERRRLFLTLMYVCVGLGVLTKGPIAVLLPGLAFAVYLIAFRELRRVGDMLIPVGTLIVLAIVVPWYATLYLESGWKPIESFLFSENMDRWARGFGVNADRPVWWYLPVVFSDSFPWSLFLFPAAALWLRERSFLRGGGDASFRVRTILWIWILCIVGFFSLSAGKQDLYIYPIVPAVVALAGLTIARSTGTQPSEASGIRMVTAAIGGLLVVAGAGFLALFNSSLRIYVLDGSAFVGSAAIAGGLAAILLATGRRARAGLTAVVVALIAINWVFVLKVLPSFEAYKPAPAMAKVLEQRAAPADLIVTYNVALPSLVYYLRRHTDVFYDHGPVLDLLRSGRPMFLLVTRDDYERAIKPAVSPPLCQITSQPTFDVKLKNVLARSRMPEILLMSNRCD